MRHKCDFLHGNETVETVFESIVLLLITWLKPGANEIKR
jgi:hypothetical protein